MDDPRSAQRYLEDLTPGGSEYVNNPQRCYEWALGRIESAHRIAVEAALERNRLREENERLRTAVLGLSRWDDGAPCFCSLCPETPDDHEPACQEVREERDRLRHALVTRGNLDHLAQCPSCLAERTNGERHEEDCPLMLLVDSIRRS